MYNNEIYDIVKDAIVEMDYDELIACGAPADEFDFEIDRICERITEHSTVGEISNVIADVFGQAFDRSEAADNFIWIAEKIESQLKTPDVKKEKFT